MMNDEVKQEPAPEHAEACTPTADDSSFCLLPSSLSAPMLLAAARAVGLPPFRGGAVENLDGAPMGKGHGNAGQPFDLESACFLKPIFAAYDQAIANGTRLLMVIFGGVKTLKSYVLEVCAADHVCNRNGDAAIFFGSESAAEDTATTRILDHFKGNDQGGGIPRFREKMETLRSRFHDKMGAILFPDKTLFILSANLGNCAQKNLAFVGVQDAYVTGNSTMIDEANARTTQYEQEAIVIIESQGWEKDCDFDRYWKKTNQQELHVRCPCCARAHLFNWKAYEPDFMTRPEEFQAVLPRQTVLEILQRHGAVGRVEQVMGILTAENPSSVAVLRRVDAKSAKN